MKAEWEYSILADDVNINRKAVLKFLPPDVTNDPDINSRFKREAQTAGSLTHPNIVTIYDVGTHEKENLHSNGIY